MRDLSEVRRRFRRQGYVIIEDFFRKRTIERWRAQAEDTFHRVSFMYREKANRKAAERLIHYVVHPCFTVTRPLPSKTFFSNEHIGGPRLRAIVSALLDSRDSYIPLCDLCFNLPGTVAQHIHRDFWPILPGMTRPLPTTAIGMTIPLVDTDESGGTLELWPGTHRIIDRQLGFRHSLAGSVRGRKGVRPFLPAGSLFLRDARLLHRGMPNLGGGLRPWLTSLWMHPLILFPNKITLPGSAFRLLNPAARKQLRYAQLSEGDPWRSGARRK